MFLKFVFVFVYTVIRAQAVRTSLDKTLTAEKFLFLSHGETIYYAYLCTDVNHTRVPICLSLIEEFERHHLSFL